MSGPIKVGDLVMVVRPAPCCGGTGSAMGRIHRVSGFYPYIECVACKAIVLDAALLDGRFVGQPLCRLKRIDPLTDPESIEHREELTA